MVRTIKDYEEPVVTASKSALLELMTALRIYRDAFVLIGGWVPYLLLEQFQDEANEFKHVGSIDIDLAIDPKAISYVEYASIVEIIERRGYQNRRDREGDPLLFSFEKSIKSLTNSKEYKIHVDFLSANPEDLLAEKHRHVIIQRDLRARSMKGCLIALRHKKEVAIEGILPGGGKMQLEIMIADVTGCLGTKGLALGERFQEKDAYDIYSVIANYKVGPVDVANEVRPWKDEELLFEGLESIRDRFRVQKAEGPAWVANFMIPATSDERERLITDAYMNVTRFFEELEKQ